MALVQKTGLCGSAIKIKINKNNLKDLKGATTFRIKTHSIKCLHMTLSINDAPHNWTISV